jgi:hypothetical protein
MLDRVIYPPSVSAGTQSASTGTVIFSNSNGVTFGMSGNQTITASVAGAGVDASVAGNSTSAGAGYILISTGTMTLAGGNNITISQNGNAITFSGANVGGAQTGISGIVASDATYTSGTVSFSGFGGGVTVKSNTGQRIDISVAAPVAQTNQTIGLYGVGNTTQNSSTTLDARTLSFDGLGIISVGYSNGSIQISATDAAQTVQSIGLYALGNTTQNSSTTLDARTLSFNGLGIITVGYSNGSIQISATTAAQTVQPAVNALGVSNTGNTLGNTGTSSGITWVMAGSGGITASESTAGGGPNTIWFSVANPVAQTVQPAINAFGVSNTGNTLGNTGTSSGITWVVAASGGITASESTAGGGPNTIWLSVANPIAQTVQSAIKGIGVSNTGNTLGNTGISTGIDWAIAASGGITASESTAGGGPNTIWLSVANPIAQTVQSVGLYGVGNTTQSSSTTLDARTISFDGLGGVTVGFSNGSVQISGPQTVAQTAQTVGLYGVGNTTQNSSTTLDARTISFDGLGGITVGFSNGSVQISGPAAQTNQTVGLYAVGNTTQNSSTTLDARTLSFDGLGAATMGFSNGSVQVSVPVQTVQTVGLYAVGNTTQNSSTTLDARTISFDGLGFCSVGFSNGSVQVSVSAAQTVGTIGFYGVGNTTQNSSTTLDRRTVSFDGLGIVTVGFSNGSIQISASQSAQSAGFYAVGNTTQSSSTTLDARTVSFDGLGAVTIGFSNGSIQVSAPVQTNQTGGVYASSNTTVSTSGTYDARSLSIAGAGAISIEASNSGFIVSSPVTSSLSGTGWVQISTNGSTISIGATTTMNLYAVGTTFGTSSGTADMRTLSISGGSGIQVAASNSGWVIGETPVSVSEPFPIVTGTAYSSHAPASWWFNRVLLDNPLAISNIYVVKSLNAVVPTDTIVGSSGTNKHSYSHGITIFSRQNYGAQSSNLTTVTTASMGYTASLSYTGTAQSAAFSWVTNTTGGTTSFSTTSSDGGWSVYFTGPKQFAIPCVMTLQQGEYFFAHAHSTTTGTAGNSNFTLMSFSNLHIAPAVINSQLGILGSSQTFASLNPWGMGGGIASAVTTNASMAGSVISGQTQNNWYVGLSNI